MQNDIESKIREAAGQAEPPFNEQAWRKMEALLDRDNDRRRPILWLLIFLLAGGGIAGYFLTNTQNKQTAQTGSTPPTGTIPNKTTDQATEGKTGVMPQKPVAEANSVQANNDKPAPTTKTTSVNKAGELAVVSAVNKNEHKHNNLTEQNKTVTNPQSNSNEHAAVKNSRARNNVTHVTPENTVKRRKVYSPGTTGKKGNFTAINNQPAETKQANEVNKARKGKINSDKAKTAMTIAAAAPEETAASQTLVKEATAGEEKINVPQNDAKEISAVSAPVLSDSGKKLQNQEAGIIAPPQKSPSNATGKPGKLFIAVFAGLGADPDHAFNYSKANPFVPKYGVAVGYALGKRSALTLGFNIHKKKYVADTNSYNIKAGSYWSYYHITDIEAVCKVYEIPLMFHYNIAASKKFNYFLSAGLASFIMKKEDYDYYYYYNGSLRSKHGAYTKNEHLFASALIGGFVERKINNSFSLQLSPAFAIPLKGIGYGEVKLYSSQLMFGLKYTPGKK